MLALSKMPLLGDVVVIGIPPSLRVVGVADDYPRRARVNP
jgi:hypothetical protein